MNRTITCFGYGSLVNRDTRPFDERAADARLHGWQRVWSHRIERFGERGGCTSLSVRENVGSERVAGAGIDGVVASIDIDDLPALDARENGYERHMLPVSEFDLTTPVACTHIAVYVSRPANTCLASVGYPLLQSYIDCVMAGFFKRFGADGLLDFLATTDGWQSPVVDDRLAPRYRRAVQVPLEQLDWFDSLLLQQRRLAG